MKYWEIESMEKLLNDLKGNKLTDEEKVIQATIKIELFLENQKKTRS